MTRRTDVHRDDVSEDDVSETFDNRKRPPEGLFASSTTDHVVTSIVPSLPPMILPSCDQQDSLQGIWICHNCDAHCPAKNNDVAIAKSGDLERGTLSDILRMSSQHQR